LTLFLGFERFRRSPLAGFADEIAPDFLEGFGVRLDLGLLVTGDDAFEGLDAAGIEQMHLASRGQSAGHLQ
jgi:hypothetical protein